MTLTVPLDDGRAACLDTIDAFVRAVDALSEYELLGASRCHGWSRLDVVVHVIGGWQSMLGGLVSSVDSEPTVDAASYWSAFVVEYATDDPVPELMSQRRRSMAYARPASATAQLRDVAAALRHGVLALGESPCAWQGHVFAPGDYLAVWAVEVVVHHLDLLSDEPPPPSALALARTTVEALVDEPLPPSWTDTDVTLIGTGRQPAPAWPGSATVRFPVFG